MSYDPTIGRWTTEDPIAFEGGDADLYRYVGNNPTNFTDPSGLLSDGAQKILCAYNEAHVAGVSNGDIIASIIIEALIAADGDNAQALGLIMEIRGDNNGARDNDLWASADHFFNAWNGQDLYKNHIGKNFLSRLLGGIAGTVTNTGYTVCKIVGTGVPRDNPKISPTPPTWQQWWWGERGGDASLWYSTNMQIQSQEWQSFLNWMDELANYIGDGD